MSHESSACDSSERNFEDEDKSPSESHQNRDREIFGILPFWNIDEEVLKDERSKSKLKKWRSKNNRDAKRSLNRKESNDDTSNKNDMGLGQDV